MSLRNERLARQQERFRNKGGLSKFEKSANKLVLNLNSVILKQEHVEGRVPPPQSPVGSPANSTTVAVAKAADVITAPPTYSHSPVRSISNALLVPSIDIPKQQAARTKASSSRVHNPQPTKKRIAPAPTKQEYQSDDDELALIVAPGPIPTASIRKPKHSPAAKLTPAQTQGSTKSVDDGVTDKQTVAEKKGRSKPSRAFLEQAEVAEVPSPRGLSSEPPAPALKRPRPKRKEPTTVRPKSETEGGVKDCATEASSSRRQKRKARAEESPAEKPKVPGKMAMNQSGIILSCPVVAADGDKDGATQGPPKKQRRRVLVDQPCTWDAEDQVPRRVLKLPGHK